MRFFSFSSLICASFFLTSISSAGDTKEIFLEIVEVGKQLNQDHLCPATSGNFSIRVNSETIAITASGKHKGELTVEDLLLVNLEGKVLESSKKSSAETLLHTTLYADFSHIGAVLHTHTLNGVILSKFLAPKKELITEGYEIHKVFGTNTHESELVIPIFENSQDMVALSAEVSAYLKQNPKVCGYLIRGHGLYTWGRDMKEARYRVEAFEHIFASEIALHLLNGSGLKQ